MKLILENPENLQFPEFSDKQMSVASDITLFMFCNVLSFVSIVWYVIFNLEQ